MPDQVGLLGCQLGDIFLPGPRIGAEILSRRELSRIDKDRDDDLVGAALGEPDERHMAVMESTHGWDQCDGRLS